MSEQKTCDKKKREKKKEFPKNNSLQISAVKKHHVTKKKERERKKEFGYLYKFSLNSLMNMTRDWPDLLVYAWLNRLFSSTVT